MGTEIPGITYIHLDFGRGEVHGDGYETIRHLLNAASAKKTSVLILHLTQTLGSIETQRFFELK